MMFLGIPYAKIF